MGENTGASALISNSYSLGDLISVSAGGGFVGSNTSSATIESCYSTGQTPGTNVLGFSGSNSATIENSYWNTQTSGNSTSNGGTGLTDNQMKNTASFVGFDFDDVWDIDAGNSYPYLVNNTQSPLPGPPDGFEPSPFADGAGTEGDPYQVATAEELDNVRDFLGSYFIQISDIDLGGNDPEGDFYNGGNGWIPIGNTTDKFTGSYNGQGFSISGLYINRTGTPGSNSGLFGVINNASITNLTIESAQITGGQNSGVLVGQAESSEISDISVSGTVSGNSSVGGLAGRATSGSEFNEIEVNGTITGLSSAGGIAGSLVASNISSASVHVTVQTTGINNQIAGGIAGIIQTGSVIESSSAAGTVSGRNIIGGVAGSMENSTVRDTYSLSDVIATSSTSSRIGGFAGRNVGGVIEQSFAGGAVLSGLNLTGGFVGENTGSSAEISDSYFAGSVSGAIDCGGFVGSNGSGSVIERAYTIGALSCQNPRGLAFSNSGTITNSFWNPRISGASASEGGTVLSSEQMKQQGSFTGFDFAGSGVWAIREGITLPYLKDLSQVFTSGPDIPGHSIDNGDGWRLITTSIEGATYSDLFRGFWTQGLPGTSFPDGDPNIYVFDYELHNWAPLDDYSAQVQPGEGVAFYVFADDNFNGTPDPFPKGPLVTGSMITTDVEVQVNQFDDTVDGGTWTFAGNPFLWPVRFDDFSSTGMGGVVYVYDSSIPAYISWNGVTGGVTDGIISPFQGFLVETVEADAMLTIPLSSQSPTDPLDFYKQSPNKTPFLRIQVESENKLHNSAWISFSDGLFPSAKKLLPMDSRDYVDIAILNDGLPFDSKNYPHTGTENLQIPLNIGYYKAGNLGWIPQTRQMQVSIDGLGSLPEAWGLYLFNPSDGVYYNLREHETVKITSSALGKAAAELKYSMVPIQASNNVEADLMLLIKKDGTTPAEAEELPLQFHLAQNYPNPFNPVTTIQFSLQENTDIRLAVYDLNGRFVKTLVEGQMNAGRHQVLFDASSLSSGIYFYRLSTHNFSDVKKMIVLK